MNLSYWNVGMGCTVMYFFISLKSWSLCYSLMVSHVHAVLSVFSFQVQGHNGQVFDGNFVYCEFLKLEKVG